MVQPSYTGTARPPQSSTNTGGAPWMPLPLQPQSSTQPAQQSHRPQVPPGQASRTDSAGSRTRQLRPLTVNEALQFSPLSSIVPLNSSVIPGANALLPYSQPIFAPKELRASHQTLDAIEQSLVNGNGQSSLANNALVAIQPLLQKNRMPEFNFKIPLGLRPASSKKPSPKSDTIIVTQPSRLQPFACMILNASNVGYTLSPTTGSSDTVTADVKPSTPKKQKFPPTPTTPKYITHNETTFTQNAKVPAIDELQSSLPAINSVQAPQPIANGTVADSRPPPLKPIVVILPLPTHSPSQYKIFPDVEPIAIPSPSIPRKRKREESEKFNGKPSIVVQIKDPKSSSSAALRLLQEILNDVFEVETNGELDGSTSLEENFLVYNSSDQRVLLLTNTAHAKIDAALQKVISLGRLHDTPSEQLCRLQKLCEKTLTSTEDLNIRVDSAQETEDVSKWLEDLEVTELSLRASRTALRVMTAGREEKQIYPEELLQKILDLLSKVMDHCIVPVVESRKAGSSSDTFDFASRHKKIIARILYAAGKVTHLLADLLVQVEQTESTINAIEFFVARMLFIENAYSEKDSVLDPHKFEAFRRTALDVLAEIFSRYSEQRSFIITEILSSLQKLPVTRQQARQFKLGDGKAIQLVSALIMRLVQTSGKRLNSKVAKKRSNDGEEGQDSSRADSDDAAEEEEDEDSDESSVNSSIRKRPKRRLAGVSPNQPSELESLYVSASRAAQQVVNFLVARASTASKSGDQPHRNLLDIFVEDLIAVLGFPEWPAAELLLRALVAQFRGIIQNDKSTAPAKTMALELYGLMGSAIVDMTDTARHLAKSLETDDSNFGGYLLQMTDDFIEGDLENGATLTWKGPYCAVIESLHLRSGEDRQVASAEGFLLTQWSRAVLSDTEDVPERNVSQPDPVVTAKLSQVLSVGKWLGVEDFEPVTSNQCRLAYALIVLNLGFCRAFAHILDTLLDFIRSDQITVRSKSLKSVTQLLEKDPTLLDRTPNVIKVIINCTFDSSAMVRDSALILIGKIMVLKPAMEVDVCKSILNCSSDTAVGIRKRSMKLLKDIYCRSNRRELKVVIADSLMQRTRDVEESVAEGARQMFEEMWLAPFWPTNAKADAPQTKVALKEQVSLLVKTAQRGENVRSILDSVLSQILSSKSKNADVNTTVCKAMVADCFDGVIDSTSLGENVDQRQILQMLAVFSKADPKLFSQSQLRLLQPYITNLATTDDLNLFRLVVIILRHVLPTLSAVQTDFLEAVQRDLLQNMTKLAKSELNEVVACLWTIAHELKNIDKLTRPTMATVKQLYQQKAVDFNSPDSKQVLSRVQRLICIASHLGKHCDLESQLEQFKNALTGYTGGSVSELIVDSILPYMESKQPLDLREAAFDGVGLMCQAWPKNFNRPPIARTFQRVLKDDNPNIQQIVLSSFRDFFAAQDQGAALKTHGNRQIPNDDGRLGGSLTANDNDGAAALIAQAFLPDVLRIALATQDAYALTATEVIASITRQGLVHPKECGPALVALETSTNPKIAEVAIQEHRNLHQQHESMFEREYMRAINEAFVYQRDIVKDSLGATSLPLKAKLGPMFEIIKTSKAKYQAKFLSNFCGKINFDFTKLDMSSNPPAHLELSRFLVENLAFLEYGRVEELQYTISCLERLAAGTGAGIAHAINTEVFQVTVESILNSQESLPNGSTTDQPTAGEITPERLRQLCTASMILSMVWETRTFLRRLYGVKAQKTENKAKAASKDMSKAPTKVNGVYGDKFMQAIAKIAGALEDDEKITEQCKAFAELMAIDDEVKVAADSGEDADDRPETPLLDDDGDTMMVGSAQSKRSKGRGSVSANGTPLKSKRGRPSLGGRKKSTGGHNDEDSY
ncbi:MAG: Sister chromatid cohesion protein 2 [Icmadophila ericetorum]|nr:Sister chromatid cohesion protein 2 [Icmadophila ericetorum]